MQIIFSIHENIQTHPAEPSPMSMRY